MPVTSNSSLKLRSSASTPCFMSSSVANRRPRSAYFTEPKRWESEDAKSRLWGGLGLDSYFYLAQPFEFIVLTFLILHISL